jgi:hypothetical protein
LDHGTSLIVASTPCAAAGAAGAGVDVAADTVGLLDDSCAAGELVGDEHPAAIIAAIAKTPTVLSNLWFMLMSFPWNGLVVVVMARLRPKARRILK